MTPPAVGVHLEYPRQTNATTSYKDINNLGNKKIFPVVDDALQVIDDIITNTLQRVQWKTDYDNYVTEDWELHLRTHWWVDKCKELILSIYYSNSYCTCYLY